MKTQTDSLVRCPAVLWVWLAVSAVGPQAGAQTPAGVSIELYAGLTLTGTVGTVYTVQSTKSLVQPDWRGAGVVQLPSSPYLWVDTAEPVAGHRFYRALPGPTNLAWIPPGRFTMGSPPCEVQPWDGEKAQTIVTLTRGFFMGRHEVTQGEYWDVTGHNPSYFRNGTTGADYGGTGDAVTDELSHPVESVSWYDATNYCARLTMREEAAGRLPAGWVYRLPTEAEWEYACRGGTTTAFHYGPVLRSGMANFYGFQEYDSSLGSINNPDGIFLGRTTPVGSYEGNAWGLQDMHGNVWEWCLDAWDGNRLPGGHVIDPTGPATGTSRVIRGGSWTYDAWYSRSATRNYYVYPMGWSNDFGFRVVLAPGPP